ncbi:SGNH/GDSL hydrolase family protein [Dermatophilus congolensis]|uniref:Uncharacterized protein n=1 Tax=Dermatophilus congolensis TaxID=1863 RepID=A0A239VTB2_9MICO|nr:SGNH/GDSL hydrolase family protein [Dermatophilus congolensis]MBO3129877.1 hypothetical protein [Dermatophilus congolensis]MBO3131493.1 hypothetical protein [Dermatophilus congolensis]MBO3134351.1 hypothetical protein [Dermatophilus congolensis]MBO3136586.1 hypothetical protein [Dermatophilus congolensis]MBO3138830.1 hypothetical protein [Dermatophilus congolensis]
MPRHTRRTAAAALISAALLTCLTAAPTASAKPTNGEPTWAALGDSISSGYGITSVSPTPSAWGAQCGRADGATSNEAAMPVIAQKQLASSGISYRQAFTACAGATTDDWAIQLAEAYRQLGVKINTPIEPGTPTRNSALVKELDAIAASGNRFDLITMTFGANNAALGALGELCMDTKNVQGEALDWDSPGWGSCDVPPEQATKILDTLTQGNASVPLPAGQVPLWSPNPDQGEVEPLLSALARFVKPGGRILIMGYPQIITDPNHSSLAQRWNKIPGLYATAGSCNGMPPESMKRVRETITELNTGIQKSAEKAQTALSHNGVTIGYVDMNTALGFESAGAFHGVCSQDPWVNDPFTQYGPLHPNAQGHGQAGKALAELLRSGK